MTIYIQTQVYDKFWEMIPLGQSIKIGYGEMCNYSLGDGERICVRIFRDSCQLVVQNCSENEVLLNNKSFGYQSLEVGDQLSIDSTKFVCVEEKQEKFSLVDLTKHSFEYFTAEHLYTSNHLAFVFPNSKKYKSYVVQVLKNFIAILPYCQPDKIKDYNSFIYHFVYEEQIPSHDFCWEDSPECTVNLFFKVDSSGIVLTSKKTSPTLDFRRDIEIDNYINKRFEEGPKYITFNEHPSISFKMLKSRSDKVQFCVPENMIVAVKNWS